MLKNNRLTVWMLTALCAMPLPCAGHPAVDHHNKEVLLRPIPEIDYGKLHFYFRDEFPNPAAVIFLVPGVNRDGRMLVDQEWLDFAKENKLNICAITMQSDLHTLDWCGGYYVASRGSGGLLISALIKEYGEVPPMLMFGWSGGAHFTSSFVENFPEHVKGWCAYSAEWWSPVIEGDVDPPGIVACGEHDKDRVGPSFNYFLDGRKAGRSWTWVKLKNTRHRLHDPLEAFVRDYFLVLLKAKETPIKGFYYDSKTDSARKKARGKMTDLIWFPNNALINKWKYLHRFPVVGTQDPE